MKKLLLPVAALLLINVSLLAQVPNANFTCWNQFAGPPPYEEPCGWISCNPIPGCVAKTTDSQTDSFALVVRTIGYTNPLPPFNTIVDVGHALTGTSFLNGPNGFPYTQRPNNFCAWVKYSSQGLDSAEVKIRLYKWNGALQMQEDVAEAIFYVSNNSPVYQIKMANFQYFPPFTTSGNPDTACVFISSSHPNDTVPGDSLKVDNIILMNNCLTVVDDVVETHPQPHFYPNPAEDIIYFSALPAASDRVKIFEITGKKVAVEAVTDSHAKVDVKSLRPGIYFYAVYDDNNRVVSSGKFSITR